jgi:hypothetical protein
MAAGHITRSGPDTRLDEDRYPFWKSHFTERERRRMIDEDLKAAAAALILAGVVGGGVILAIISVWVTR